MQKYIWKKQGLIIQFRPLRYLDICKLHHISTNWNWSLKFLDKRACPDGYNWLAWKPWYLLHSTRPSFFSALKLKLDPLHIMLYSALRSSYSEVQCNGLLLIVHLAPFCFTEFHCALLQPASFIALKVIDTLLLIKVKIIYVLCCVSNVCLQAGSNYPRKG